MTMVINGSGTITGLSAGGLPDASITSAELASGAARANFGAGAILQVVNATVTGDTTTTSTSYGTTGLYATITPTSASSKIICLASSNNSYVGTSGNSLQTAFYRGTSGNGSGAVVGAALYYWITATNGLYKPSQMMYVDSPASTSALTYTVMHKSGNSGSSVGWCNGFASSNLATLILMEVAA
jgi:hypothetical protein